MYNCLRHIESYCWDTGFIFVFFSRNRSKWKWFTERSKLASRWTWLQSCVIDLESKIKTAHSLLHAKRSTKALLKFSNHNGTVRRQFPSHAELDPPLVPKIPSVSDSGPVPPNQPSGLSFISNNLEKSIVKQEPPSAAVIAGNQQVKLQITNGIILPVSVPSFASVKQEVQPDPSAEDGFCMRTLPFDNKKFEKRKLLRLELMTVSDRVAAKYSSSSCQCNNLPSWVGPCVICSGRYNYRHELDAEYMPFNERASLLDPGCHPVLCLPNGKGLKLFFQF